MSKNLFIRGTKRKCGSCQTLFYDLEKYPIICPNCGAAVSLLTNISKRGRPPKNNNVNSKIDKDSNVEISEEDLSINKDKNNESTLEEKDQKIFLDSKEENNDIDVSDEVELDDSNILDNNVVLDNQEINDESDEVENIIAIDRDEETQN